MALDPQSKIDLKHLCNTGMKAVLDAAHERDREDVFYVPLIIALAIQHDENGSTRIIGADLAVDDDQPRDGVVSVLETMAGVLKGEPPPNVSSVQVYGADLS